MIAVPRTSQLRVVRRLEEAGFKKIVVTSTDDETVRRHILESLDDAR